VFHLVAPYKVIEEHRSVQTAVLCYPVAVISPDKYLLRLETQISWRRSGTLFYMKSRMKFFMHVINRLSYFGEIRYDCEKR
jgi:hypothetical protein